MEQTHRSSSRTPSKRRSSKNRKRNRRVLLVVSGVVVVLIAAVAWVGVRALLAKQELESAVPLASRLQDAVRSQDKVEVSRLASALNQHASAADSYTSDPVWRVAEFIPVAGPNLTAVRQISDVLNDVSTKAVAPLTRLATSLDISQLRPVDGAVDLKPLQDARVQLSQASQSLKSAQETVRSIDTTGTIRPVTNAVAELREKLTQITEPVVAIGNAAELLPAMLGADSPRNYLLLFQNPAELRSTGGIPGALALISTEKGKLSLTQQASSADFPRYETPVVDVPEATRGLYGNIVGEYIQDVTLTPDFALSARIASEMWTARFGTKIDGVVSIDPVALSYLLKAAGPVSLPTGEELTSDNVVSLLLNETYIRYPKAADQDLFFAASAASVFEKLTQSDVDGSAMLDALEKSGDERRILIWNAAESEQKLLAGTTLAGGLPRSTDDASAYGLFINDATGAKMDYYLDVKQSIGSTTCRKDGRPFEYVSVTLSNNVPTELLGSLPTYVTGGGVFGVEPGKIKSGIAVYSPPGALALGVTLNGESVQSHAATNDGHSVLQVDTTVAPGESVTFVFGFLAEDSKDHALQLQTTPFINMNETSELSLSCESALW